MMLRIEVLRLTPSISVRECGVGSVVALVGAYDVSCPWLLSGAIEFWR